MKKLEFKNAMAEIAMNATIKAILQNIGKGATYKITMKSNNCYIALHRYDADLQILIFRNGNVALRFKEFCHGEDDIVYYEYDENDDHEALLKTAKKDLKMLISDYVSKKMDYHIFMDYLVSGWGNTDVPDIVLKRDDDAWVDWYKAIPRL